MRGEGFRGCCTQKAAFVPAIIVTLVKMSWFQLGQIFLHFIVSDIMLFWLEEKNSVHNTSMFLVVAEERGTAHFSFSATYTILPARGLIEHNEPERARNMTADLSWPRQYSIPL